MALERARTFADLLREHRRAAGMTQEELAERAGLSARALRKLESGASQTPRRDTVALLASALQLSPQGSEAFLSAARGRRVLATLAPASAPLPSVPSVPKRTGTPSRFVGRVAELDLLECHLEGEGPPLLLVAGEPGIGKSRLLAETAQRAQQQGWTVLQGGCTRRSGQEPYAPLLGAIAHFVAGRSSAQLQADREGCGWLARLLPELVERGEIPAPAWSLPPAQERRLMFAAVERMLANVAGPPGTLLILDDLQWAGLDALDLLAALARNPTPHPLRLLGAYRSTEISPDGPLTVTIADLASQGLVTELPLGPLGAADAHELVADLLADTKGASREHMASQILARAGGVPFFLISCAREVHAVETGAVYATVPWTVHLSLRQRIAALPEPARALLGLAAVAGRELPRRLLLAVADAALDVDQLTLLGAIELACATRLLAEDGNGDFRFVHDLIRETVLADLSPVRRAAWHFVWAEAMERRQDRDRPVQAAALAWHFSQAGEPARALPYALAAGDRAASVFALAEAERHYQDALALVRQNGDRQHEVDALAGLAHAFHYLGRYDDEVQLHEQAIGTDRAAGNLERAARLMARLGEAYSRGAHPQQGIVRLQGALEVYSKDGLSSAGVALLYTALAILLLNTGRFTEQLRIAAQAVEFAQCADDAAVLRGAQEIYSAALSRLGRIAEAIPALEAVLGQAEAAGDLVDMCRLHFELCQAHTRHGDLEQGRAAGNRAVACAEQMGDSPRIAVTQFYLGDNAFWMGDWATARRHFQCGIDVLRQVKRTVIWADPPFGLGRLCAAEGQWDEALRLLGGVLQHAEDANQLEVKRWALAVLAEWDLVQGRADCAHERLAPLLDQAYPPEEPSTSLLWLGAWAHLDLGDAVQAREIVTVAICRSREHSYRLALADSLRVAAMVAARQERWAEARDTVEEAVASAEPFPYAKAKALYIYGDVDTAHGEPRRAQEHYQQALAILNQLGERLYAEQAERVLAALPAR